MGKREVQARSTPGVIESGDSVELRIVLVLVLLLVLEETPPFEDE